MKTSLDLSAQGSFQITFSLSVPAEENADSSIVESLGGTSIRLDEVPSLGGQVTNFITKPTDPVSEPRTNSGKRALSPISVNATIAVMINNSLQSGLSDTDSQPSSGAASWSPNPFWHFSESHLEIVARFHSRTAMTIGNKNLAPAYRDITCQLAFTVCLFRLEPRMYCH